MRAKLKAQGMLKEPVLQVAKARTTVNRKEAPTKGSPYVMALDLSMAKTGLAWGVPGMLPDGTLTLKLPKELKDAPEGERIAWMSSAIVQVTKKNLCNAVIFSEFYNASFMIAFRANVSLRGSVMALLVEHGIEARGVAEVTARKAAGVDISKRHEDEKDGFMKARAKETLKTFGLGHLAEDEGDAAILLLGATAFFQNANKDKYDLTDFQ